MTNRIAENWSRLGAEKTSQTPDSAAAQSDERSIPIEKWFEKAEHLVTSHPGLALAVAAGAGILLGWLVKRR